MPGTGLPDWDAKSYKATVVRNPAGTILMVEQPNGQGAVGNIWPCISLGRTGSGALCQIDRGAQRHDPNAPQGVKQGMQTYRAHGQRFNYLFYDGHVQTLRITETAGTGTTNNPRGLRTIGPND